jgi:hypothetical protein
MVAQYVSHRYTLARERDKARLAAYQELFAPIVAEVCAYIDSFMCPVGDAVKERYFRERHEVEETVSSHIWRNVGHAKSELLRVALLQVQDAYHTDFVGEVEANKRLRLFHAFMVEYYETVRRIYPRHNLGSLLQYRFRYRLWSVLASVVWHSDGAVWDLMTNLQGFSDATSLKWVLAFERATEEFLDCSPSMRPSAWRYLDRTVFQRNSTLKALADKYCTELNLLAESRK